MSTEKRKSTRLESDQFISYRLYDANGRVCDEGMAKATDISRTGVAVEHRSSFEVGSKVEMSIALSEDLVNVEGIVRNVEEEGDEFQIGIEFTSITEEQIKLLSKEFPAILD